MPAAIYAAQSDLLLGSDERGAGGDSRATLWRDVEASSGALGEACCIAAKFKAISKRISDHDFAALAELQVANAYEPYGSSGQTIDLGIARKFTFIRPFASAGAQAALDKVQLAFPSNSYTDVGCAPIQPAAR